MLVSRFFRLRQETKMTKKSTVFTFLFFSLLSIVGFQNCEGLIGLPGTNQGTSTGNPSLHLSFDSYSISAVNFGKVNAAVTAENLDGVSIIFCVSGISFKTIADYEETGDNDADSEIIKTISYQPQEVSVSPLGTDLGFVDVPAENYRQIEFSLSGQSCESQKSVQVVNSNGTFSSDGDIKLKFNGNKPIDFTTKELQMMIVPIVEVLSTVANDAEIKGKIESVNGLIKD